MKKWLCMCVALLLLLCACSAADGVETAKSDADEEQQPEVEVSEEAAESHRDESSQAEAEEPPVEPDTEAAIPDESVEATETRLEGASQKEVQEDPVKEEFIRLLRGQPELADEAELWDNLDEIYETIVTKGEIVHERTFSYREPLYFARERDGYDGRLGSIAYLNIFHDEEIVFELEFASRDEVDPMLVELVDTADTSILFAEAEEQGIDASDWSFRFFTNGNVKGMEVMMQQEAIAIFAMNGTECAMVEQEDLDPETLQVIQELFASME